MTNNGKIIRPTYNHSDSDKLAIKTVQVYYNIVEQLQNGHAPDKEAAEATIEAFEQLAIEMSRIPEVQIETLPFTKMTPYLRERGDYLSKAFKPLFKIETNKKQIALKKKEVITVVMLFDCYLYYIYDEDAEKASEMTTQFIIDLASWYRDSGGDSISRSSIYEYISKNTLGINLVKKDFCVEDLNREIILAREILKVFFINNDINYFPDKFGNLKGIVIDFHTYVQQVLAD